MSESLEYRLSEIVRKNSENQNKQLRLSDYEFKELSDKNYQSIISENPVTILDEYYPDVRFINGRYKFSRRGEDASPSCFFSLKDGAWIFNDFGDSSNEGTGTIISIVKSNNPSLSYNEVIKLCLTKLNLKDNIKEAFEVLDLQNHYVKEHLKVQEYNNYRAKAIEEILKTADENAKIIKENNSKKERESKVLSRITYASKQIPAKFIDLLAGRGIKEASKNFYYIKGENFKETESGVLIKTSSVEGVGVITANNENLSALVELTNDIEKKGYHSFNENLKTGVKFGGDVHILPYLDSYGNKHKTRSFGVGGITLAKCSPLNKKIAIFESKMDYHAMDNLFKFHENGYDILLANSTNNSRKIIKYLKENNYDEVFNVNQFDLPALDFNINIMYETNTKEFKYLEYKADEYKKDANDLIYEGVPIFKRVKIGSILDFKDQMEMVKAHLTTPYELNTMKILEDKLEIFENLHMKDSLPIEDSSKKDDEKKVHIIKLNRSKG